MIYSSAFRINNDNIVYNTAIFEIVAAATVMPALLEMRLNLAVWSGPVQVGFALGRPAAVGATRVNHPNQQFMSRDFDKSFAPGVTIATGWGTRPTVPANYFRRGELLGSGGPSQSSSTVLWRFPRGLTIAQNGSLVLWSIDATASPNSQCLLDVTLVINA